MLDTVRSKTRTILISTVLPVAYITLFVIILMLYKAEGKPDVIQYSTTQASQPGYVAIYAKVWAVDPLRGDLSIRLQFEPRGELVDADNSGLAEDLLLDINSATGKTQILFKKGERMNPTDITVDIYGDIGNFPFDEHSGELILDLYAREEGKGAQSLEYRVVPFTLEFAVVLTGFVVDSSEAVNAEAGYTTIIMNVRRSTTAITFAVFIMMLEWLLALSAVGVTIVWVQGRKMEVTMFSWMGALLFALIPLRSAMPGAPPVGVLSDFLSFFWAETIVALCLVTSVATWLIRGSEGRPR